MSTSPPAFALLSVAANQQRHAIASGDPWILLLDLVIGTGTARPFSAGYTYNVNDSVSLAGTNYVNTLPATKGILPPREPWAELSQQHLRLARYNDTVYFNANDGNGVQAYEPFNFDIGEFKQSSNGSVPSLEVQVSNVLRAVQALVEQYTGVVGNQVFLYALNSANPNGEPDLTLQFTVISADCDVKLAHFKLGAPSPLRRLFPLYTYYPNTCIWQYKSAQCGYSGALASCSKTLDGAMGCEAHANQLRFGGFPGINTNGATAAGVS